MTSAKSSMLDLSLFIELDPLSLVKWNVFPDETRDESPGGQADILGCSKL